MELPKVSWISQPATFLVIGFLACAVGCQADGLSVTQPRGIAARNNAASLLYDLLGDEKNVSKLLIIKRDRQELHDVIKNISATADAARKSLEKLAREDATLDLKASALPPGEKAARESTSKARAKELLQASGAEFEFKLLLTQAEALGYATHLAKVAAENESSPDRAKVLSGISDQMQARHRDVVSLLGGSRGLQIAK